MSLTTSIAIYFLLWWITLFAVLPWGVRSQGQGEDNIAPGTDPGAPVLARIWTRLLWTTLVSALVFAAISFAYSRGLLSPDLLLPDLLKMPR